MMLDYRNVLNFIPQEAIDGLRKETEQARETLLQRTGAGSDYLGWLDYPETITQAEIEEICQAAAQIKRDSEVLLVIGIGGSYLGAKATLSLLDPYFSDPQDLQVLFVGHTLSPTYTKQLLDYLQDKDFSINVISKSGTTTEPAVAFRLFQKLLSDKYGAEAYKRVYVTTTKGKGALYHLALARNYHIFTIPEDIGGRYSVLTPVGLLPIAAAGYDIGAILTGARDARRHYLQAPYPENDAMLYAAIRNLLYRSGKKIEVLVAYEPKLAYFGEWYKQLFGESEGKEHRGLYPSSLTYTTDLHSLGQYVQDGERLLFETVIRIMRPEANLQLQKETDDFDSLNYLAGKSLSEVNEQALRGTLLAHVDGGVPNLLINLPEVDAYRFGYLVYFFMFACGLSGYLLKINPFNQEGVEAYKKNMFALLGKPGYEELRKALEGKMKGEK
jgi:glucose-6-phosphate isomerase